MHLNTPKAIKFIHSYTLPHGVTTLVASRARSRRDNVNGEVPPVSAAPQNAPLITRKELMEELGVTAQCVWRYQKDGMPHVPMAGGETYYNLEKVRTWMQVNGVTGKQGRPATADDPELAETKKKLLEAKLAKETVLTKKHEHLLDLAQGRVLKKDEVENGRLARVATVKAGLLALPGKMAARLAHRDALDVQRELQAEMLALLRAFAGEDDKDITAVQAAENMADDARKNG